jgi:hypothetical protein
MPQYVMAKALQSVVVVLVYFSKVEKYKLCKQKSGLILNSTQIYKLFF